MKILKSESFITITIFQISVYVFFNVTELLRIIQRSKFPKLPCFKIKFLGLNGGNRTC